MDITTISTPAINKFRNEYTDASDAAFRGIADEIRAEGRNAWVERNYRELLAAFPEAHQDDVESTLRSVVQDLSDAGAI
jgi:hypothetical protein